MVLEQNMFVEQAVPGSILRQLTDEEMAEYRRPFLEPGEGRRPTLSWPRQIPIEGEPADVHAIVSAYAEWQSTSPIPKLFIKGELGAILSQGKALEFCRSWPEQREVAVARITTSRKTRPMPSAWLSQPGYAHLANPGCRQPGCASRPRPNHCATSSASRRSIVPCRRANRRFERSP
jgi:hypothetical protein